MTGSTESMGLRDMRRDRGPGRGELPGSRVGSAAASRRAGVLAGTCLLALLWGVACTPKVVVETPKEPIVINMNVKIEHEIRVKIDEELDDLIDEDEDLF